MVWRLNGADSLIDFLAAGPKLMSPSGRGHPMDSEKTKRYRSIPITTKRTRAIRAIFFRRRRILSHSACCSTVQTSSRSRFLMRCGFAFGALHARHRVAVSSARTPHFLQIHIVKSHDVRLKRKILNSRLFAPSDSFA